MPASISEGDELTIGLSRALAGGETIELFLQSCSGARTFAMTRATGSKYSFTLSDLHPSGPCAVTATVRMSRMGTIAGSFARELTYGDGAPPHESGFIALQERRTKTQLVVK